MHPSSPTMDSAAGDTQVQPPPLPSAASLEALLDSINHHLSLLLLSSLTARSFFGRWQLIRTKLTSLLSSLSSSPHWSPHPLLLSTLLPSIHSTLSFLHSLSLQCSLSPFPGSKLHMQSDLDMASSSLSDQLQHLDLLLHSGVLHQATAIVLSHPAPSSSKDDVVLFIRDLFTRLQIGGNEFKMKALDSLLQLLSGDEKSAVLVSRVGNVAYLIHLLDLNNFSPIREQAATALSILVSLNNESRKIVFEAGGLGPLLKVLETGSNPLKEKAAVAVEAITADPENAWAISAYGGVHVLMEACRSGSPAAQCHALGAIRNVAVAEDVRTVLAEEGAVPLLVQMLCSSVAAAAREKAVSCIAILASSHEKFQYSIIQERGLQRLMDLLEDPPSADALESTLRTVSSLSKVDSVNRILSSSTAFIVHLGELIKHGRLILQQLASSLISELSISDGNKRAIANCMSSLVRLMESPKPVGLQESASSALVSLLTVRSNRKDFMRDEKSVTRLVQMLDPRNETVLKKLPVAVVAAVAASGGDGCRRRLVAAGACQHLQKLSEMEIAGARKASQRLAGSRLKTIFSRTWKE
ncbi:hypothetical protein SAY87_020277 [Trapa incisa]|uniref:DUF7032 domain-containing protein n=1 Tax=Trapa incisa TaxID=236973 RepID=A0AAN7K6D5_9MYRT|nr:hypothetical protein SAY87_020277 [Trapa incisa]